MRRISGLAPITTFLILFTMLLAACGGTTTSGGGTTPTTAPKASVTVGLVTDVGGLNDGGYNQFSHAGYEKARTQYGFPDVVIQSQVISDSEYTKNITAAAQQANMVIGVGFLMQNAIYTVAKQYPNKKFALIDGCATNPTDKSGACVSLPYSNDFSDPTKCAAIADKQFSDDNADILFQVAGGCGIGVLDSATKHKVYSIGVDVDQSKDSTGATRPSVITSAVKRIDTAAYGIVNLAETGKYVAFAASPTKFDINNDGVGYAPPSSEVPADAVAKATDFANQMKSGTLTPPETIP